MRPGFVLAILLLAAAPAAGEVRHVAAEPGALPAALAAARPGDVLVLARGSHAGPVLLDKALTLEGDGDAVVTGPGEGSVIRVTVPGVTIRGLTVTGSGLRLDGLDSGIALSVGATGTLVEGNRIEDNLIGIDVQGAHDVTLRGNVIRGRDDLRTPERGPGIYVWNAPGLLVEGNDISLGRDGIFVSSANHAVYRDNRMHGLRFAFHSMYANDITLTGNRSTGNGMGFAFMYSTRITARENLSDGDRTHGFFLNFVNYSTLEHNEVRNGGEKCLFVYNANRNRLGFNRFQGCDIGIHFTAGSEGVEIAHNAFIENRVQAKYVGSRWLEWSVDGSGNYWSDNAAFDIDGDGRADAPYRPNDAIDRMTWTQPMARLLLGAPAMQLVSWSQSRFPGLLPGGITDSAPLLQPGAAGLGGGA